MFDSIEASGTVHWLGAGLSTGRGLRVLCDQADRVVVWARDTGKAEKRLSHFGVTGRAVIQPHDLAALDAQLRPGDVLVSMLPAGEHPDLLRLCVGHRAHFACSSYLSDAIKSQAPAAKRAGVVVLTEAGLDPGIDHVLADLLVERARDQLGDGPATARFTSYCGGIPAVPNEFRYQFSWAPLGVLTALRTPCRYIEDGVIRSASRPWEAARRYVLDGEEFEVYPNRDSLPYLAQYAFPDAWRSQMFVRGTLRPGGWLRAWADVFPVLCTSDDARIARLADDLAARYPTTQADRDRVVLAVELAVTTSRAWSGRFLLDVTGEESESAMSRCVSLPLAHGVSEILTGRLPAGPRQAAQGARSARRWLEFLTRQGITCQYRESEGEAR